MSTGHHWSQSQHPWHPLTQPYLEHTSAFNTRTRWSPIHLTRSHPISTVALFQTFKQMENFPKWRLVIFIFFPYAFQLCASLHHSSPASAAAPSSPAGVGSFQMTSETMKMGKRAFITDVPIGFQWLCIYFLSLWQGCAGCVGWGLQCDLPNYLSYSYMWHIYVDIYIYIYTVIPTYIFHTYMIYEYL